MLLIFTGTIIYLFVIFDILQTTLSMKGGGWITSKLSHTFWKIFFNLSGRNGHSKLLSHTGYLLLISIVITWVFLLWLSLVLLLSSDEGIIINSSTKENADIAQIIYYSGYTLSTMGMGDFIALGNNWRLITAVYSFTGLIILTMSVTYFIPVLSAVIQQRKLGIRLSTLGNSPQQIIHESWNGENLEGIIDKINQFSGEIIEYSQQHRAYPVIHYFHNTKSKNAIILQLARLYEAVIILSNHLNEAHHINAKKLRPILTAYQNYFEVLHEVTQIKLSDENPPYPKINDLENLNILKKSEKLEFSDEIIRNRKFFKKLVAHDGWQWSQIDHASF